MNTLFLTSSLNLYFDRNKNEILTNLKEHIKKYDNFVFIGNGWDDENLEEYFYAKVQEFQAVLPFKSYKLISSVEDDNIEETILDADFIFVSGGHVPTQNKFLEDLRLKELLEQSDAVVCGESAGSINCARLVYCPPELEGESIDRNFRRYLMGLGLTSIKVMPHFNKYEFATLDNQDYVKDILLPDSKTTPIFALNDGSYILQTSEGDTTMYGDITILKNGVKRRVCNNNSSRVLTPKNFSQLEM